MKAEGLKYFTDIPLTLLALIIFVVCFVGFVIWVYRKGSSDFYGKISKLPFSETLDSKEGSSNG